MCVGECIDNSMSNDLDSVEYSLELESTASDSTTERSTKMSDVTSVAEQPKTLSYDMAEFSRFRELLVASSFVKKIMLTSAIQRIIPRQGHVNASSYPET